MWVFEELFEEIYLKTSDGGVGHQYIIGTLDMDIDGNYLTLADTKKF